MPKTSSAVKASAMFLKRIEKCRILNKDIYRQENELRNTFGEIIAFFRTNLIPIFCVRLRRNLEKVYIEV